MIMISNDNSKSYRPCFEMTKQYVIFEGKQAGSLLLLVQMDSKTVCRNDTVG